MLHCEKLLLGMMLLLTVSSTTLAQAPGASSAPSQPPTEQALLKPEQLEALVAPIALYPDELLANVLAASTYPLEIVQADRWVKGNKNLKGDRLKAAVDRQGWDDSIKALVPTPDVIAMMSDKVEWTKDLGDAVLAQQPDVMDAIQRLRAKAQARNMLVTNKQQKVSVQKQDSRDVIVVEQAQPDTIYVPYYDPATVYGEWPYTDYPPYYFGYPSYIGAGVIAAGLAFGTGWAIARWGNYWGGGCNWFNRNVYVNHFNRNTNVGNAWQHNAAHRQGVRYPNQNVANRFGGANTRAGVSERMDFRGRDGQQVLKPGGDRQGAGDRTGDRAANRAGAGAKASDRGGNRAAAADRARGGDRTRAGDRGRQGAGNRAANANRARGGRGGGSAFSGMSSTRAAGIASARGQMSLGGRGGGAAFAGRGGGGYAAMGGGGFRGGGGGGFRGGGGGGFRGGGGGRRSDIALKHDVVLLGRLANGLGYYRFSYLGSDRAYVGVIAQEVLARLPDAVTRGADGYLRVHYGRLGLKFRSYAEWLDSGARLPATKEIAP